jgi:hypothetical protein
MVLYLSNIRLLEFLHSRKRTGRAMYGLHDKKSWILELCILL